MSTTELNDLASKPLISIGPHSLVFDAAQLMIHHGIRHLPVSSAGCIVGVISANDVSKALSNPHLPWLEVTLSESDFLKNRCVHHYMSGPAESIDRGASLSEAAKKLLELRIGSLLVTDQGKTVGIVTVTDLLRAIVERPEHKVGPFRALVDRWSLGVLRSPVGALLEQLQASGV
jgi:acetoin utilization protein AcuB